MNQAKIFWDRENYVQVEKLFRGSAELCGEADVWRLNVAHTLFMQVNHYLLKKYDFKLMNLYRRANSVKLPVSTNRSSSKTTIM